MSKEDEDDTEHTKGKRESTRGKHEAGRARKKKDKGGERGDQFRRLSPQEAGRVQRKMAAKERTEKAKGIEYRQCQPRPPSCHIHPLPETDTTPLPRCRAKMPKR